MIGWSCEHACERGAISPRSFLIAELIVVHALTHPSQDIMTEPPPTEPLHEKSRMFFETLGRCIAAWVTVDDELFRVFRDCLGPYEQSAIIFYRLPGLEPRLTLTDEIVASVLPKPERKSGGHDHESMKEWKVISKQFEKLLATRRRLAHQPVSLKYEWRYGVNEHSFGTEQLLGNEPPKMFPQRFAIHSVEVGERERMRSRASDLKPLTERDLLVHLSNVRKLANNLNEFCRVVLTRRLEKSPPTASQQGSDP